MRFLYKEIIRDMLKHWKYALLIVAVLISCSLMVFTILYNLSNLNNRAQYYRSGISDKRYFQMQVNAEDMEKIYGTEQLKKKQTDIVSLCKKDTNWELYSYAGGQFCIPFDKNGKDVLPDTFEAGYGDPDFPADLNPGSQTIYSFFFSPEVFRVYGLKLSEGEIFRDSDYIFDQSDINAQGINRHIPVILGADYKGIYKVGDVIKTKISEELTVIGFFAKDSMFASADSYGLVNLNKYIVSPLYKAERMEDGTVVEDPWCIYNNISSYCIATDNPGLDVQREMNKITNLVGFPAIQCLQWGGTYIASTENVSERNIYLLSAISVVLVILGIMSISSVLTKRTSLNLPAYAAYMISGVPTKIILISIVLENITYAIVAIVPAVILSVVSFGGMVIPYYQLLLFSVVIAVSSVAPACRIVTKTNLDQLARRKSE